MDHHNFRFIINPISGTESQKKIPEIIERLFYGMSYEICHTQAPGDGKRLAEEAVKKGCDVVVAIGGDGTVNEVAQALVYQRAVLGIVPTGSGNGLARHLKIPLNVVKALQLIKRGDYRKIDTIQANGQVFFNVGGVGFDAHIGKAFAKAKRRGFFSYLKLVLVEYFRYEPQSYEIYYDGNTLKTEAFLVSFANSSQYGNRIIIAPNASLEDGMLDLVIIEKFPFLALPGIVWHLLTKRIDNSSYVNAIQCSQVAIKGEGLECHLDGEPVLFPLDLSLNVIPKSLNVILFEETPLVRETSFSSAWEGA